MEDITLAVAAPPPYSVLWSKPRAAVIIFDEAGDMVTMAPVAEPHGREDALAAARGALEELA